MARVIDLNTSQLRKLVNDEVQKALRSLDGKLTLEEWPPVMSTRQAAEYLTFLGMPGYDGPDGHRNMYSIKDRLETTRRGGKLGFPRKELDKFAQGKK